MNRFYIMALFGAIIFCAYMVGVRIGRGDCRESAAVRAVDMHLNMMKKYGEINAETLNLGVGDIRRVLRERYTIGE